ncbi:MAG: hypothetical protein R2769_02705 [Saprospiraceae bacterium]
MLILIISAVDMDQILEDRVRVVLPTGRAQKQTNRATYGVAFSKQAQKIFISLYEAP